MTKPLRTSLIAVLTVVAVVSATTPARQDLRTRVRAASDTLLCPPSRSMTQATVVSALNELLDIVVSLSARLRCGPQIRQGIDVARELLRKTSLFNETARQYLSFAHRMLTGGLKYERPKDLDQFVTMEEAQERGRTYCRMLVSNALAALDRERPTEAATLLLRFVLSVVTPVSG